MDFVPLPGGPAVVGSTTEEVAACVEQWASRLVDPSYTPEAFRRWILKEVPRHVVRLAPFRMSRFPVTNGEYFRFARQEHMALPESIALDQPAEWPVWGVSYPDCRRFAVWMGAATGAGCRLPTESEWEYAARGPDRSEYPFGNQFDAGKCNTVEAAIGHPTAVDTYAAHASAFGICDMAGNVEEWTASRYRPYEGGTVIEDDLSAVCGHDYRILRGGSFARNGDLARCARRHGPHPGPAFRYRGFRLVAQP